MASLSFSLISRKKNKKHKVKVKDARRERKEGEWMREKEGK